MTQTNSFQSTLGSDSRGSSTSTGAALARIFSLWRRRWRGRRELVRLDESALRDLALNSAQVDFEASKPFWRA